MSNQSNVQGDQNIVLQGVTDSTITVNVNGTPQELERRLDSLLGLLDDFKAKQLQLEGKQYFIDSFNAENFDFLIEQLRNGRELPSELAENLITDKNIWVKSLERELLRQGVSVGSQPQSIFEHYGWLIEVFLLKMNSPVGRAPTLRRLSFMAEAYQSSLRYLCYIQLSQLLPQKQKGLPSSITAFLKLEGDDHIKFDYLNLLLLCTEQLQGQDNFMPEIAELVEELTDPETDLYSTAVFLARQRDALLAGTIEEDDQLAVLLDQYLTGLVYWLRYITFLARYRLVSIKDINLSYRLGTAKNFIHRYGELHGVYAEIKNDEDEDYKSHSVQDVFTFNQSILLLKDSSVEVSLQNLRNEVNYLSLSPLLIDQSVFADKTTQTPEIFYYTGRANKGRKYVYDLYKNELRLNGERKNPNKQLVVQKQNIKQPKLDELFDQLQQLFKPAKRSSI